MSLHIDIDNVIAVASENAEQREAALAAVKQLAAEAGDKVQTSEDRVFFHCEWEPPFKALKKLSKEMPDVTFSLWAEAFQEHHWICKVEYVAGKGDEQTLSRIDDEFGGVFQEIFGCDDVSWEKTPQSAFLGWFPNER
ncbi:hypothetical protein [Cerasicoccus maritimus]|uniref:DUF1281 family ferredoxin-like fold protein n=1 Tax=Cerasicoccus maritimus TaxID=490089 RepID=UPI002852B727|nr:hypothetical protein [Cerasicoccus maritimus]